MPDRDSDSTTDVGGPAAAPFPLPRVTIKFCTQCKWNLRAAYFAQELLSTFSTSLGEVALQPSTGGTFIIDIFHTSSTTNSTTILPSIHATTLWDRATDGGFPETKELKRRVRDVIEPGRNLGHVDRDHARPAAAAATARPSEAETKTETDTEAETETDKKKDQKEQPSRTAEPVAATASLQSSSISGGGKKKTEEKEACEDCN